MESAIINENRVLGEVIASSKKIIETFKFQAMYSRKVTEKQEKRTEKVLKQYREKNWKEALKKANGDKKLAYKYYIKI